MLAELAAAKKRLEELQEERLDYAQTIASRLFDLELEIQNDTELLYRLRARRNSTNTHVP